MSSGKSNKKNKIKFIKKSTRASQSKAETHKAVQDDNREMGRKKKANVEEKVTNSATQTDSNNSDSSDSIQDDLLKLMKFEKWELQNKNDTFKEQLEKTEQTIIKLEDKIKILNKQADLCEEVIKSNSKLKEENTRLKNSSNKTLLQENEVLQNEIKSLKEKLQYIENGKSSSNVDLEKERNNIKKELRIAEKTIENLKNVLAYCHVYKDSDEVEFLQSGPQIPTQQLYTNNQERENYPGGKNNNKFSTRHRHTNYQGGRGQENHYFAPYMRERRYADDSQYFQMQSFNDAKCRRR